MKRLYKDQFIHNFPESSQKDKVCLSWNKIVRETGEVSISVQHVHQYLTQPRRTHGDDGLSHLRWVKSRTLAESSQASAHSLHLTLWHIQCN